MHCCRSPPANRLLDCCRQFPQTYGKYDQSIERYVPTLIRITRLGIPFLSLLGVTICMIVICYDIIIHKSKRRNSRTRSSHHISPSILITRAYRREMVIQSLYFVLNFIVTYGCWWAVKIIHLSGRVPSNLLLISSSFL